ncbi:MAG: Rid family detoxifying hydrolase [Candidatus Latescibacteria bacterium]|jgi:2-iminobutanoate/2-iminopropanoate deaminase|nr:Rid family detoxifying hydrolase [Candidatus Latescibacterota bacterium]
MMPFETSRAPINSLPYSQAIIAGDVLYTSGQVPVDPETGQLVPGGIEAQTERVLESIKAIVEDAGSTMARVVKMTVYLQDLEDFDRVNEIYARYFPESPPARTTVGANLRESRLVEMDAVALMSG